MLYPALDIKGVDAELALAIAQDFSPSAAEEHPGGISIFFMNDAGRARARAAIARVLPAAILIDRDVDDEDWARRSQEGLQPVTVGLITVAPPQAASAPSLQTLVHGPQPLARVVITIQPSTGFGTGHHATTRLCLAALQTITLDGRSVLDVGTGSGVLAIAARKLGASDVVGIDSDPDAVHAAEENLRLNPGLDRVRVLTAELESGTIPIAEVVLANLTGASLVRFAERLAHALSPGGVLVVSGLLEEEQSDVIRAFRPLRLVASTHDDEWVCLILQRGFAGSAGSEGSKVRAEGPLAHGTPGEPC